MKRLSIFSAALAAVAICWGAPAVNVVPSGYTFSPAAGSSVEVLSEFSVTTTQSMFLCLASRTSKVQINGETVESVTNTSGPLEETLTWVLANPINEPGDYIITIPAGTFWDMSESDNEVFVVGITVTGGELPAPDYYAGEITTDPEPGYVYGEGESVARMSVMSPKLTTIYVGPHAAEAEVWRASAFAEEGELGEKVEVAMTLTPDEDSFNEAHVMWLDFPEPIAEPGRYTLRFPAQAFIVSKYPNNWYTAPMEFSFTIEGEENPDDPDDPDDPGSGVGMVGENPSQESLMTLDGRRVPADVKPAPGIYVSKGRKVVVI